MTYPNSQSQNAFSSDARRLDLTDQSFSNYHLYGHELPTHNLTSYESSSRDLQNNLPQEKNQGRQNKQPQKIVFEKHYCGNNVWSFRPACSADRPSSSRFEIRQFQRLFQMLREAESARRIQINLVHPSYGSDPKDYISVTDLSGYCALI